MSHCTATFQLRKLRFREIEPIAKVLEAVTGLALSHPAPALACGYDLRHKTDAVSNSGSQPLLFLLCSTLTVLLWGDIQPFTVLGTSPLCNPGKLWCSGMIPRLYWVPLQASCVPCLLHAPQSLHNVWPPVLLAPRCNTVHCRGRGLSFGV